MALDFLIGRLNNKAENTSNRYLQRNYVFGLEYYVFVLGLLEYKVSPPLPALSVVGELQWTQTLLV